MRVLSLRFVSSVHRPLYVNSKSALNLSKAYRSLSTTADRTSVSSVKDVTTAESASSSSYLFPHPIWPAEYVDNVRITHRPQRSALDWAAYLTIQLIRFNFDWMSGWSRHHKNPTAATALNRIIFLETVAAVPGSIAGIIRHLASLRRMKRDGGWIHTLIEEAENERMHLLTALQLKQPSLLFKGVVFISQGIFFNFFLPPIYYHLNSVTGSLVIWRKRR